MAKKSLQTLLYLLLLLAGIFLAWQVHTYIENHRSAPSGGDSTASLPDTLRRASQPASMPAGKAANPLTDPFGSLGIQRLQTDPEGIAPPPDSYRIGSYRRSVGGERHQWAVYQSMTPPAKAYAHYAALQAPKGWRLLGNQDKDKKRVLVFARGNANLTVTVEPIQAPQIPSRPASMPVTHPWTTATSQAATAPASQPASGAIIRASTQTSRPAEPNWVTKIVVVVTSKV